MNDNEFWVVFWVALFSLIGFLGYMGFQKPALTLQQQQERSKAECYSVEYSNGRDPNLCNVIQ